MARDGTASLAAFAAYTLGMLIAQLTSRPRSATATAAFTVTGLYLLTNVADQIGPAGALRYLSPFLYVNRLVRRCPGHGLSAPAVVDRHERDAAGCGRVGISGA